LLINLSNNLKLCALKPARTQSPKTLAETFTKISPIMRLNKIEDLIGKTVKIIATQTTYMVVNFQQEDYKIDFDRKEEFLIKKGTEGIIQIELQHPLLINYQEDFVETFINSQYSKSEELLKIFEQTINEQTKGY